MATRMDVEASDDGGELMAANQQLGRELLQSQQSTSPAIVHSQRMISLGTSPHYVSHWTTADAFRELYQNWYVCDALCSHVAKSDQEGCHLGTLPTRSTRFPAFEDARDHFAVVVPDPTDIDGRRSLGFIKYDKKSNRVTLANACMQLPVEALELGFTTKTGQDHLAGSHGEGLQLAAVALSRDGYSVQAVASQCSWCFHLCEPQGSLCCTVTPPPPSGVFETDGAEGLAELRFRNERDVAVLIGPGRATQGRSVSPEEFLDWLQISLEIRGLTYPSSVVETSEGDLLFVPRLHGRIYAHGVLLPEADWTHSFRLGYHFPRGKATRDRQWRMDRHGVAERVCRIWESALQVHEELLLPVYVGLLRKMPAPMDVDMAADLLLPSTASRIWKYLRDESQGKKFFHCATAGAQEFAMIREMIGKRPARLPQELWHLLRSTTRICSAEEELSKLFRNAQVCKAPDTIFSRTVQKALRACLALIDSMRGIHVVYVRGVECRAEVLYDAQERTLKIHRRWLDFEVIHQQPSCRHWFPRGPKKGNGKHEPFFCGHVVEELLSLCISSVFGPLTTPRVTEMKYMRHIRRLLRHMPHQIIITATPAEHGLIVTWEDDETESFRKHSLGGAAYHVILHDESCTRMERELLHSDSAVEKSKFAVCGCRQQFVPQRRRHCVFADLDDMKKYYAMVSLNERSAFFGLVSEPVSPHPKTVNGHWPVVCEQSPAGLLNTPSIEVQVTSSTPEPRSKRTKHVR